MADQGGREIDLSNIDVMGDGAGTPPADAPEGVQPPEEPSSLKSSTDDTVVTPAAPPDGQEQGTTDGQQSTQLSDEHVFAHLSEKLGRAVDSYEALTREPEKIEVNPLDSDPELKAIADWRARTGRPVSDWVKFKSKDFESMDKREKAQEILQHKYPNLSPEQTDYLLKTEYFGDEEVDDHDALMGKSIKLEQLLADGMPELLQMQQQYDLPDPNVAPSQEEQQRSMEQLTRAAYGINSIDLSLDEGFTVPFTLSQEKKAALAEFSNMAHWVGEDGQVNPARAAHDYFVLQNWQELIRTAYQQGVAKGKESEDIATRNITLNKEGPTHASVVQPNENQITVERPSSSRSHGVKIQVGANKYK